MIQQINTTEILDKVDPGVGIGDELLDFVLKLVPYIGIELFIKNTKNECLLSFRDDDYYHGWHFIGGMLRWRESWADRIIATAKNETGVELVFEDKPFIIKENTSEVIDPRGHSINMVFKASIKNGEESKLKLWDGISELKNGDLCWFEQEPENILEMHRGYFDYNI